MDRSCTVLTLASLLLFAGAGCEQSIEPIDVAPGCPERPPRGSPASERQPPAQLISDFESGTEALAMADGRNGSWILGTDGSSGKVIAEASNRCAARGGFAGHFAGKDFVRWGANWTAVFMSGSGPAATPYDASKYSGMSFWAAFGGENGPEFEVPMGVTTMDNAWNSRLCSVCMDFYRTWVPLSRRWQRFVLPFSTMAQEGRGVPQVPVMKKDQLVGFILWPSQQFDIWIDDVRFEP